MRIKTVLVLALLYLPFHLFAQSEPGWEITANSTENYNGVTLANGSIGVVSGSNLFEITDIVLNGVFDKEQPGGVSRVVRAPLFANIGLFVDGEQVRTENCSHWKQVLNMKEAYLKTSVQFKDKIKIETSVQALRNLPYMALIRVVIYPLDAVDLRIQNSISFPEELVASSVLFKNLRDGTNLMPLLSAQATSKTGRQQLGSCSGFLFSDKKEQVFSKQDSTLFFTKKLEKNKPFTFGVIGASCSSRDFVHPRAEAERMVVYAQQRDLASLLSDHKAVWHKLWQSDIVIEGCLADQLDVRLALYNLYSFVAPNTRLSIAPMGLSTATGYNGHVFWDAELWMFPPLLLLNPSLAKSLVDYRTDRLPKAKQRARIFGMAGAMYPWESDDSGEEATPTWCLTGTFEHHITADIGIAFWNYYCVTKDLNWLRKEGYEVLQNVADFWVARATKNSDGSFSIQNVIGADEFAPNVDDNAFTNGAAKTALYNACKAAKVLQLNYPDAWKEVADGLVFAQMQDGTTKEHAHYQGEVIKQADVNLLAYPLETITDKQQIKKDLVYYEPKIYKDGPAMGNSILSILYASLGNKKKAYALFKKSYMPNKRPPFGVLSESAFSNNPYFATGAGGLLQVVLNGFGGLRITDSGVVQKEVLLPDKWKSLTIKGVGPDKKSFVVSRE